MPNKPMLLRDDVRGKIEELRDRLGLFSFRQGDSTGGSVGQEDGWKELGIRPGGIVEWLVAKPGAGVVICTLQMMSRFSCDRGVRVFVDSGRECYPPALSGWGISPNRTLVIRPSTRMEECWAIEQCLRCPGVSATWAWVDRRVSTRVHRRWQLAAEKGGGVGLLIRPAAAQRESVWADLRLLATPLVGGQGEVRRIRIDVLYRRGGVGGIARVWEIDHAAGAMRLVPELAHSTTVERTARA